MVAEARAKDGRSPVNEQTLISLQHSGLSQSSLWTAGAEDLEGIASIGGFALVDRTPESLPSPADVVEVNLVVAPSARGRGVGRALAGAVLDAFPGVRMQAWSHGNHPGAGALAASLGFDRVRDLWLMRREAQADLPPAQIPEHVVLRTFRPDGDAEAFLALNAAAFADHPEQGSMDREDLERRMAEAWFDPGGFFVAEREGSDPAELLGFHWTRVHDGRPSYGEVYVVGVSPAAQGTGLGKALTLVGLRHLRDRGVPEVVLFVDSDNAPAVALYQRLGFTHAPEDTGVMYAR